MSHISVFLIRTFQPHWSEHSGINQFIKYVDRSQFHIEEKLVFFRGTSKIRFAPFRFLKRNLSRCLRINGPKVYALNDFSAELKAFCKFVGAGFDILFYLDGEHSLNYLPRMLQRFPHIRSLPKIVAMFHQPPEKLCSIMNMDLIRYLEHAIVLSEVQADYLAKFLPPEKISTLLHGIDVEYFKPSSQHETSGKFKCLSVGYWLRDYDTVLEVAERLTGYPGIEFHIVSSKVNPSPMLRNVHVYERIDDATLLQFYQEAQILFLPLLDATANNVILEAIACGLPVVTTDHPGIRGYVSEKEAILVPENDAELFANRILELYDHDEKRSQMASFGRQRALDLSWPNFAKQIENIFSDVAG